MKNLGLALLLLLNEALAFNMFQMATELDPINELYS